MTTTVRIHHDCVLSPVMSYTRRGHHGTRTAALRAVMYAWRPPPGLLVALHKPWFSLPLHPHNAIQLCRGWSDATGIPCDGVILADTKDQSYLRPDRLWKLKDPTGPHPTGAIGR